MEKGAKPRPTGKQAWPLIGWHSRSNDARVALNRGHDLPVFHLLEKHDSFLPPQFAGERVHKRGVGVDVSLAVTAGLEVFEQLEGLGVVIQGRRTKRTLGTTSKQSSAANPFNQKQQNIWGLATILFLGVTVSRELLPLEYLGTKKINKKESILFSSGWMS